MSYSKYYLYKKQVSNDGGVTWADVTPLETAPSGNPIATYATLEECNGQSPSYSGQYLTFVAQESGTFTFTPTSSNAISYSLDSGSTWTQGNSVSVSSGQKVIWKGTMTPMSLEGVGTFSSTNNFIVEGNPMSLIYGDNFSGQTSLSGKNYAFARLFSGCTTLTSAENMVLHATTLASGCYYGMFNHCTSLTTAPSLPATTLASSCYYTMFAGCTSLTTVPELPATTLANYCYSSMFQGCTSLTTAPTLPATTLTPLCYDEMFNGCTSLTTPPQLPSTTLASGCYRGMFGSCTSLTTVPQLPATTLANNCYRSMFAGCTSLTTAPTLSATTLANWCYEDMFYGCTSLNSITCLATNISATDCTYNWVYGVAANGTFIRDCNTQWSTGESGIPNNWQDNCSSPQPSYSGQYLTFVAQESGTFKFLKSTGNTSDIQYSLDSGSTWVTLASDTNSPTVESGHTIMWKGTLTPIEYYDWQFPFGVGRFSSSGSFYIEGNPMSLLYGDDFDGITSLSGKRCAFADLFSGCTNLTSAENLSLLATTLEYGCYASMFRNCTSLETAPTLPATTLSEWCYNCMFWGCSSLETAPTLPATTLASYCYHLMFANCTSLTTAPELLASTLSDNCYDSMFNGCYSLNYVKCLATDITAPYCTLDWLTDVATYGTFIRDCNTNWSRGASGIPNNWQDNCSTPQHRTQSGTPYCSGYDKYVDVYSQVSYDSGSTWTTTATTPTLIEADSPDCGYVPSSFKLASYISDAHYISDTLTGTIYGTNGFSASFEHSSVSATQTLVDNIEGTLSTYGYVMDSNYNTIEPYKAITKTLTITTIEGIRYTITLNIGKGLKGRLTTLKN